MRYSNATLIILFFISALTGNLYANSVEAQPTVFFYEDCGNSAPSTYPRPAPGDYTDWNNYGVGNITFSGDTDVRSTSYDNSHIWFAANYPKIFTISGINSVQYSDIKLSFRVVSNEIGIDASDFLAVNCTDAEETNYPVTLPEIPLETQNSWVTVSNLDNIPSTGSLTITFTTSGSNTYGFRLDDITLTGVNNSVSEETADSVEFKITTFNSEWLSCSQYSPDDDALQINNIATLIASMNSDVVAMQEVGTSDTYATIDTIVSRLGSDWAGNIVPYYNENCRQNQGIIYKKSKVQLTNSSLVEDGGSYYNWSSGRYPALYNLNLIFENRLIPISLINIHAKAYNDETSYNRRKNASEGLKSLLDDDSYNTKNIVFLGDFNDYLTGTQCSSCSPDESPYKNFMDDTENYEGLTTNLIDSHYNSPVIDNIIISNELFDNYVKNSVFRETTATESIADYSNTTSDHTPVSALFKFATSNVTKNSKISITDISVFPNPANRYLHIQSSEKVNKIEIYSAPGNIVLSQTEVTNIRISDLAKGIYFVKIYSPETTITKKIVKE
ncbi:MAG: T9SS type A sorting domain-containing protein [Paludibacter sp.]|nr:T9SS type A sorting domain-containing protein [Paludibacter sp.]